MKIPKTKPTTRTVWDFDGVWWLDTTTTISATFTEYMLAAVQKLRPQTTRQKFNELVVEFRKNGGSATQGFQLYVGRGPEWGYKVWEDATPDMIKDLLKVYEHDPEIALLFQAHIEEHNFFPVILSHSPRCFIRPLLEIVGVSHLIPEKQLVDIIELAGLQKHTLLPFLHLNDKFGYFENDVIIEDTPLNIYWARRVKYIGCYQGPLAPATVNADLHYTSHKQTLRNLPEDLRQLTAPDMYENPRFQAAR